VTGAELFCLQSPGQIILASKSSQNLIAAVAVDHHQLGGIEFTRRVDDVAKQRFAGDGVQDFRQFGIHALALTGSENDDGEAHGEFRRKDRRIFPESWRNSQSGQLLGREHGAQFPLPMLTRKPPKRRFLD